MSSHSNFFIFPSFDFYDINKSTAKSTDNSNQEGLYNTFTYNSVEQEYINTNPDVVNYKYGDNVVLEWDHLGDMYLRYLNNHKEYFLEKYNLKRGDLIQVIDYSDCLITWNGRLFKSIYYSSFYNNGVPPKEYCALTEFSLNYFNKYPSRKEINGISSLGYIYVNLNLKYISFTSFSTFKGKKRNYFLYEFTCPLKNKYTLASYYQLNTNDIITVYYNIDKEYYLDQYEDDFSNYTFILAYEQQIDDDLDNNDMEYDQNFSEIKIQKRKRVF